MQAGQLSILGGDVDCRDADVQPDSEYLVPAILEAARQHKVMAALKRLV